jgi:hypothetical protein
MKRVMPEEWKGQVIATGSGHVAAWPLAMANCLARHAHAASAIQAGRSTILRPSLVRSAFDSCRTDLIEG